MSRKGLSGQLSMFDFWGAQAGDGEVEMVSLMPEPEEQVEVPAEIEPELPDNAPAEDEPEVAPDDAPVEVEPEVVVAEASVEKIPEKQVNREKRRKPVEESGESPVMHSEKRDSRGKVLAEISYLNYNKVFLRREGEEGETFQFDNSKEAVDFYIAEMLKLGCGEE